MDWVLNSCWFYVLVSIYSFPGTWRLPPGSDLFTSSSTASALWYTILTLGRLFQVTGFAYKQLKVNPKRPIFINEFEWKATFASQMLAKAICLLFLLMKVVTWHAALCRMLVVMFSSAHWVCPAGGASLWAVTTGRVFQWRESHPGGSPCWNWMLLCTSLWHLV